jgi:hypothetical protein
VAVSSSSFWTGGQRREIISKTVSLYDMASDVQRWIEDLEAAWSEPDGFLWKARQGDFDPGGAGRLIRLLEGIDTSGAESHNKRLVALLWYIPIFLSWQEERIKERGGDLLAYGRIASQVESLLEGILGVP